MTTLKAGHDVRYFTQGSCAGACVGATTYYTASGEPPGSGPAKPRPAARSANHAVWLSRLRSRSGQDLGLLALELLGRDDAPVAQVGEFG
jgi:hypothetical protein